LPALDSIGFTGIEVDDLGKVWLQAKKVLEPALGEGKTIDEVLTRIFRKEAQLWIAATPTELQAACVTEIKIKPHSKVCNVWLCGGKGVNNWVHFLDTIEEWAKEQGCEALTIDHARLGWQRLLKRFKAKSIALERKI
jgi:hypothetical protein